MDTLCGCHNRNRNDSSAKSSIRSRKTRSWTPTHQPPSAISYSVEIAALGSMEQIDEWALRGLPAKNTLHAADALLIEDAFRQKIAELRPLADRQRETPVPQVSSPSELTPHEPVQLQTARPPQTSQISSTMLSRPNRADCATSSTASLSRPSPVLCAGASPPTPIIYASHNPGHSVAKSAMSSRCRSAACIIGRSIARLKSSTGGHGWASIQSPSQTSFGLKLIPSVSKSPAQIQADTFSVQSTAAP